MMPHTASGRYAGSQDDCYLPARVARRLVAKHGVEIALLRADRQRMKHKRRMREDLIRAGTPFLIIYWDIVCLAIAKVSRPVPQPIGSAA